ncbi:MAG: hypothetical protein ACK5MK_13585 [Dysgonomonas sp.]
MAMASLKSTPIGNYPIAENLHEYRVCAIPESKKTERMRTAF